MSSSVVEISLALLHQFLPNPRRFLTNFPRKYAQRAHFKRILAQKCSPKKFPKSQRSQCNFQCIFVFFPCPCAHASPVPGASHGILSARTGLPRWLHTRSGWQWVLAMRAELNSTMPRRDKKIVQNNIARVSVSVLSARRSLTMRYARTCCCLFSSTQRPAN